MSSTCTVQKHLVALKRKGYVDWEKGSWRGLRVLHNPEDDSSMPAAGLQDHLLGVYWDAIRNGKGVQEAYDLVGAMNKMARIRVLETLGKLEAPGELRAAV